jgi:hypothetical protein
MQTVVVCIVHRHAFLFPAISQCAEGDISRLPVVACERLVMGHGEYEEAAKGRCRFCGFLSKHASSASGVPSPRFYEVEHAERTSAESFRHHTVGYAMRPDTEPMCFMGKINLMAILQNEGSAKFSEAITADRKCDAWYPYMPGLSPKEHYEEYQMQRLEQDRREFELRLSDMGLEAQRNNAMIASDLREIAKKSERSSKRIAVVVIVLAMAQVIVGLVAFYHKSYLDQLLEKLLGPLR